MRISRNCRSYPKVLQGQIALARDELAGRGLYLGRKATGSRIEQLQQQIEAWEAMLEKLGGSE
ncbi:MAG TPA: hypothetical protein DD990_28240 [Cyanobacteria bacterium UBA11368]|nr:hypothetical protein [Cyanobacteria bacterium UBA11368]